jgi:arginyl-tRNA synthetase
MSFDPVQILSERFAKAIASVVPGANVDPQISAGRNPKFGDYQCNAAMSLAKAAAKPPREVAIALVKAVDISDIAEPLTEASVAGPGFINIALKPDVLSRLLGSLNGPELGIDTSIGAGRTVVVDLCGVNLAKQMHVGHLRATIIGDSLARVLARLGWNVKRQNHVGDWGLPIAMVTAKLAELKAAGQDIGALTLDQLEKLYKAAQKDCDADERGLAAAKKFYSGPKAMAELEEQVAGASASLANAKQTLLKLQSHDPATVAIWQRIVDTTMTECLKTCARLNTIVTKDHSAGESSYAEELAPMVADLEARGVAEVDEGALVIRVEGLAEPCLIRKSDGGFLYATTDICAIRRRVQQFGAARVIYCVDARQSLHFKQVFGAAIKAGYASIKSPAPGASAVASLEHAAFGSVLGDDGRPLKTRSGENVKLADLIDEAITRAERVVGEKNPDLSPDERKIVAEAVGIAAIKYADLSSDRVKDYVFNFDRMLAFEGDTGPYLLYALVRVRRIFKEALERSVIIDPEAPITISQPEEKQLALALLKYPQAIKNVGASLEPHRLCQYLYELAQTYSTFYDKCHVLKAADEPTRQSRLHLCRLVERVMTDGLTLLGVKLLDRM